MDNSKKIVISLYDYTGEALIPWAKAGYTCLAYDIQHEEYGDAQVVWPDIDTFKGGGVIKYIHKDLHGDNYFITSENTDYFSLDRTIIIDWGRVYNIPHKDRAIYLELWNKEEMNDMLNLNFEMAITS